MKINHLSITSKLLTLPLLLSGQLLYATETRFEPPETNGLPIDKCVAGSGWGDPTDLFNPLNRERCGAASQRHIATAFCRQQGFKGVAHPSQDAWSISLNWPEDHAIWIHNTKDGDALDGEWGTVTGGHHFSHITCTDGQGSDLSPET